MNEITAAYVDHVSFYFRFLLKHNDKSDKKVIKIIFITFIIMLL